MTEDDDMSTGSPPPIACTLTAGEQLERLTEFRRLFSAALRHMKREPSRLELALDSSKVTEPGVRDLLRREHECCRFFTFAVESMGGEIRVSAEVPDEAQGWLDGLQQLAEAGKSTDA
jgi:hypothetical protein